LIFLGNPKWGPI